MSKITSSEPPRIVLGDDESEVRSYLEMALRCLGYVVDAAADGNEVLAKISGGRRTDAILLDIMMPARDGFDTLREIRRISPDVPVIMLSGAASPSKVIQAMQYGATDFLAKPASHEDLNQALKKALEKRTALAESASAPATTEKEDMTYGCNEDMQQLKTLVKKVALSDASVLIQGETGTGKEVIARQIHNLSARAAMPFIKLNCAAIPSDLMESELFGYERGAFTGALQKRAGIFELAHGGTLLLDEIGDMDIRLQAKLLQALQDHEFRRLGGKDIVKVDVRVIAATHRNLELAIRDGAFRADLFYRLNVLSLYVPALRDRREDIPALAAFLLRKHSMGNPDPSLITPHLEAAMFAYDWPGNVRELENVVQKLTVLRDPDLIADELSRRGQMAQMANSTAEPDSPLPKASMPILERALMEKQQAERDAIVATLNATRWNRKQAAALLAIDYKALLYKMRKLQIAE